jgi:hypothetical protein
VSRERFTTIRCGTSGCAEHATYAYTSQREYREIWDRQQRNPYRCTRHREPEKVLRPDNPQTVEVLVARRERYGMFWRPEGVDVGGSGFSFGPGFNAHADDFPAGTRLVVTARVELPQDETQEAQS